MKSLVLISALALASSSAFASSYLCTQKGNPRPIYLTIESPEARITAPPSQRQVVLTLSVEPENLPRGYVALYLGDSPCEPSKGAIAKCGAIVADKLELTEKIANGEMQGNVRFNGHLLKCSKGTL